MSLDPLEEIVSQPTWDRFGRNSDRYHGCVGRGWRSRPSGVSGFDLPGFPGGFLGVRMMAAEWKVAGIWGMSPTSPLSCSPGSIQAWAAVLSLHEHRAPLALPLLPLCLAPLLHGMSCFC